MSEYEKKAVKLSDLTGEVDFGPAVAPEGYDPEITATASVPPGKYLVKVVDCEIMEMHSFKLEGTTYILNQLRPLLEVVEGEHAGARIMDFLAMPSPYESIMPTFYANRWGNFLRSLGFTMPKDDLRPAPVNGRPFKLHDVIGRQTTVEIVLQLEADRKTPRKRPDGTPQTGVKLFGYRNPNEEPLEPAAASGSTAPVQQAELDL